MSAGGLIEFGEEFADVHPQTRSMFELSYRAKRRGLVCLEPAMDVRLEVRGSFPRELPAGHAAENARTAAIQGRLLRDGSGCLTLIQKATSHPNDVR